MTKNQKFICESRLIKKKFLNTSYYRLRFEAPIIASNSHPGQFVNFRISNVLEPLLRRPMSIFRSNPDEGWIECLIKIVGKGTSLFSNAKIGEQFNLLGPIGKPFDFLHVKKAILAGGGIGIAPLVFLAEKMQKENIDMVFIQGFKTADEICCLSEIESMVNTVVFTTDDGSFGAHGLVTDQLKVLIDKRPEFLQATLFACGPNPMMSALEKLSNQFKLKAQFSLEAHMACGFGACVGCAVPSKDNQSYYLVCEDGPVFDKDKVNLDS